MGALLAGGSERREQPREPMCTTLQLKRLYKTIHMCTHHSLLLLKANKALGTGGKMGRERDSRCAKHAVRAASEDKAPTHTRTRTHTHTIVALLPQADIALGAGEPVIAHARGDEQGQIQDVGDRPGPRRPLPPHFSRSRASERCRWGGNGAKLSKPLPPTYGVSTVECLD